MSYPEEREKERTEHYNKEFKDHVAKFIDLPDGTQVLEWRNKNGGSNYYFNAILWDGALMIYGDLGEAVFMWYRRLSFMDFEGLNLGYFASKCCASEVGRHFVEWDKKQALEVIKEWSKYEDAFDLVNFNEQHYEDALDSAESWLDWLRSNEDAVCFRSEGWDGETFDNIARAGEVIHGRCFGYLHGIKMALKQRGSVVEE